MEKEFIISLDKKFNIDTLKNSIEILKFNLQRVCNIQRIYNFPKINNIRKRIEKDLQNLNLLNFYIIETFFILENYKILLSKPINIFDENAKQELLKKKNYFNNFFFEKTYGYFSHQQLYNLLKNTRDDFICQNCLSNDYNYLKEDVYICNNCSCILNYIDNNTLEVNIKHQKKQYNYNKKIHFIECMNQFQAKQKKNIPDELIEKIKKNLKKDGYYTNDSDIKNIKKNHILKILNNLKEKNYYNDVALIHYKITNIPPYNIEFLENKLLSEFEIILKKYKEIIKKNSMKNFINIQFILFQLLNKNGFKISIDNFCVLKTKEKKEKHEYICKQMFAELNWQYEDV